MLVEVPDHAVDIVCGCRGADDALLRSVVQHGIQQQQKQQLLLLRVVRLFQKVLLHLPKLLCLLIGEQKKGARKLPVAVQLSEGDSVVRKHFFAEIKHRPVDRGSCGKVGVVQTKRRAQLEKGLLQTQRKGVDPGVGCHPVKNQQSLIMRMQVHGRHGAGVGRRKVGV